MKTLITRLFLRLEYSAHRVDAYLADMRGDTLMSYDSLQRSWEIERRLAYLSIQP